MKQVFKYVCMTILSIGFLSASKCQAITKDQITFALYRSGLSFSVFGIVHGLYHTYKHYRHDKKISPFINELQHPDRDWCLSTNRHTMRFEIFKNALRAFKDKISSLQRNPDRYLPNTWSNEPLCEIISFTPPSSSQKNQVNMVKLLETIELQFGYKEQFSVRLKNCLEDVVGSIPHKLAIDITQDDIAKFDSSLHRLNSVVQEIIEFFDFTYINKNYDDKVNRSLKIMYFGSALTLASLAILFMPQ